MYEEYPHPQILSLETREPSPLDVYVPSLNLAFEYHCFSMSNGVSVDKYIHTMEDSTTVIFQIINTPLLVGEFHMMNKNEYHV